MTNQAIATERIEWENIFSINIPTSWSFHDEDGVISLFDPDNGVGVIQISFARRKSPQDPTAQEAIDFAHDYALQRGCDLDKRVLNQIEIGNHPASVFSFEESNDGMEYWRVWHIIGGDRIAFITYNCAFTDKNIESGLCDMVVSSFTWSH